MRVALLIGSLLIAAALSAADDQQALRAIDARWNDFRLAADTDALAGLLRDEFVLTHSDGRVEDKASYIADLRSGTRVNHAIDNFDVEVRRHGDTAIVSGRTVQRGVGSNGPFEGQFRFTRVWVRDAGGWRLAASHSSRLPAPDSP